MRNVNISLQRHFQSCEFHLSFLRMGSSGVQMVCVALGVLGLIGVIVCCAVPRWKVSSFTGSNIVTAQVRKHTKRKLAVLNKQL